MTKGIKENKEFYESWLFWVLIAVTLLTCSALIDNQTQQEILADQLKMMQEKITQLENTNAQLQSENSFLSLSSSQLNRTNSDLQSEILAAKDLVPDFVNIARTIASEHEWVYHQYMCGDFSNDLVSALRDQGWSAKRVLGYHYENGDGTCSQSNFDRFECKHYWVIIQVPIEATIGEIIDPQIYAREYVK